MKLVKMLALTVVAAGALIASIGASTASATVFCATTVETCPQAQRWAAGNVLDFALPAGTSASLVETGALEGEGVWNTCKESTVKYEIFSEGSSIATTEGWVTGLTWGKCSLSVETKLKGRFEVHRIAGTSNGTVTSSEPTRVAIDTVFFGDCVYTIAKGQSIGDITEGNPALLHLNSVMKIAEGNELVCPLSLVWTATYTLKSPVGRTLSVGTS